MAEQTLNTYSYIDTSGKNATFQAATPDEALKNAPNLAKNSGVQLEPTNTQNNTNNAPQGNLSPNNDTTQATNSALTAKTNQLLGGNYFDTNTGTQLQKTPAQIQQEADALANQPISGSDTSTRTSANIESDFQSYLDKLGAPPTAPNTQQVQQNAETQVGLSGIQSNLQNLSDTYAKLQNDIQNKQAGEASKPGVIASIINGRMQMISAEDNKALSDLKTQISDANTQLKNANTAVDTIMKNTQTDYTNAEKSYNDSYQKAYQMFTAENSNLSKQQASASANAKTIISSFKGSQQGFNTIDTADNEASWNNLELQAGLPTGFISAAIKSELNIDKWVKTKDGTYVQGFNSDGTPFVAKVSSEGGTGGTTSTQQATQNLKADTSKMSGALDSIKGTDGMVSNEDWNAALKAWIAQGYTSAQFNTAFKSYKSTNK